MRVGFVLDSGAMGGAEKQALLLAKGLLEHGWEVVFFYLNRSNSEHLDKELSANNISYYDLNFSYKSDHFGRILQILKLQWKLRIQLKPFPSDSMTSNIMR